MPATNMPLKYHIHAKCPIYSTCINGGVMSVYQICSQNYCTQMMMPDYDTNNNEDDIATAQLHRLSWLFRQIGKTCSFYLPCCCYYTCTDKKYAPQMPHIKIHSCADMRQLCQDIYLI